MAVPVSSAPWSDLAVQEDDDSAFVRLWRGFATARVSIAVVLLVLLSILFTLGAPSDAHQWLIALCGTYLAATLAVRVFKRPPPAGREFDPQWVSTIGVDLVAFSTLQFLQAGGINYTPLFAVPVLMASVLGTPLLAFGTAAGVTLLLLNDAWVLGLHASADLAARFLQAGLSGTGLFALAFLANQLALRLASEEAIARRSQRAARAQAQVNQLVIETLSDGVLVVDPVGGIQALNPAGRALLGGPVTPAAQPLSLATQAAWAPLMELAQRTFTQGEEQRSELSIDDGEGVVKRLSVRTRLTGAQDPAGHGLCVVFLQDLREMETRLHNEKLAAMGRMSAAVAHEIRNPLAAIAQANALLAEDLQDAEQRQLSDLVAQNARRLAQIVEDVLDISRLQQQDAATAAPAPPLIDLDVDVGGMCDDWVRQTGVAARVQLALHAHGAQVPFGADHLRRVLVNLLDNALRYAGHRSDSIQVATTATGPQAGLVVWSDGAPLDPAVQRHMFEPFYSSESRSSGLGLYICRELCERHGALIGYRRCPGPADASREGNEFFITFRPVPGRLAGTAPFATIAA